MSTTDLFIYETNRGEEQQEVASALDDRAVVDYLFKNPEFFIRNAARRSDTSRIRSAVRFSLVEWHMMRARNHIHVLEENMSLLMEQAVANKPVPAPAAAANAASRRPEQSDDMLNRLHRWGASWGWRAPRSPVPDCWRQARPRLPIWH